PGSSGSGRAYWRVPAWSTYIQHNEARRLTAGPLVSCHLLHSKFVVAICGRSPEQSLDCAAARSRSDRPRGGTGTLAVAAPDREGSPETGAAARQLGSLLPAPSASEAPRPGNREE